MSQENISTSCLANKPKRFSVPGSLGMALHFREQTDDVKLISQGTERLRNHAPW